MNTIICNSELEFRNYLIEHSDEIINVMVLEDKLDKVIYFYSFTKNSLIIASKEFYPKDFGYYSKKYQKLIKTLGLNIEYIGNNPKILKLKK
jgi:hypothetical protein